jgi:hypothetical protein
MDSELPTIRKKQFINTPFRNFVLSIPFIYGALIPMLIFDLALEIYHHVCFPMYGLRLKSRNKYFFHDRLGLPKLNWVEKVNCEYCTYANGLAAYFVAIAAETEAYWCAIKHRDRSSLQALPHEKDFIDFERFG